LKTAIKTAGLILAGGQSSRMGLPKAELPFGPERMIDRVLRVLSEIVSPIIVVSAPRQQLDGLPTNVIFVRDEREAQGPLEGLRAGLAAIAPLADAAYATSCDVPLLVPSFVSAMIERLDDYDAAVPVEGVFSHPLAAVYRTSVRTQIENLLAAGNHRAASLLERVNTRRVPIAELKAFDPALSSLRNLNQPEDYLAALSEAGFEPDPAVLAALRGPRTS
jgi:molybdopterin-guanine dinucleotide biosynthesis protein A